MPLRTSVWDSHLRKGRHIQGGLTVMFGVIQDGLDSSEFRAILRDFRHHLTSEERGSIRP